MAYTREEAQEVISNADGDISEAADLAANGKYELAIDLLSSIAPDIGWATAQYPSLGIQAEPLVRKATELTEHIILLATIHKQHTATGASS